MKTNNLSTVYCFTLLFTCFLTSFSLAQPKRDYLFETKEAKDQRMAWWREARFGMFIHWGLYAVPAGEWNGKTIYGEWIRHTAQIPLETYDKFLGQFNPVKFNADAWVRMAKDAGMKYLVITSKHHDGFCLFDSKYTDFDVMSTPFKRDILKELSIACKKQGVRLCFYHSIMDWHHPDYLPRRNWEDDRPPKGAKFNRYVSYMKKQLKELCTMYDAIGVLWFDGEWESTWNDKRGTDLYNYVRNLQPPIIINNRVGAAREGMEGTTAKDRFGGDFGTPEQQIPATGLPGVDWETCMTMNDNWGYNKADKNFKTTKDLLQKLADIASKGGNFLLNVGPTAEGTFPQESIDRLREIGVWMKQNGESVYGTKASPFESLDWGRCTQKTVDGNTRLYLHVFERPTDGQLRLPGIANEPIRAFTLTDATKAPLRVVRQEDALLVSLPAQLPDPVNSVFVLDLKGAPDVHFPPKPANKYDLFLDEMLVSFGGLNDGDELYYTLDGSKPTLSSTPYYGPFKISKSSVVAARRFRNGKPVSGISFSKFTKTDAQPGVNVTATSNGLSFSYYEGVWDSLPEFSQLAPLKTGKVVNIDLSAKNNKGEFYAFVFKGFLKIPEDGVYALSTSSDDGSDLWLNGKRVVDNNRLQGMTLRSGLVALKAGLHEIEARYFQKTGGDGLELYWESEKFSRQMIPASALFQ